MRVSASSANIRGHWQIEVLHHIRDVSYGKDASQIRADNGPQVMATLRNLAIGICKLTGPTSIAAACRHHARDATRTLDTLGISPPLPKPDITPLCRSLARRGPTMATPIGRKHDPNYAIASTPVGDFCLSPSLPRPFQDRLGV